MNEGEAPRASRVAAVAGALLGGTGVALAAVAAHGEALFGHDPRRLAVFRQGVDMQIWHALALLGASALARRESLFAPVAIAGFIGGTLAFAVGVDALALGWFDAGRLAPLGGGALIASWFALAAAAWRAR